MSKQVLFIQGGGAGAHDEWDNKFGDWNASIMTMVLPNPSKPASISDSILRKELRLQAIVRELKCPDTGRLEDRRNLLID
jgi:hypothetical protein